MDLIYTNANGEDIGVLFAYELDLAFGESENDFECTISSNAHCCSPGSYLYMEGTEYGGIVDAVTSNTGAEEVTYSGRTWHGILNSKILCPDSGQNYLTVSGDANTILGALITRMGLASLFRADSAASGITISSYQFARYISGYNGILKMLSSVGAKLKMVHDGENVVLSAAPIADYSQDGIDNDQTEMTVKKTKNKVNHLICLGSGELADRMIVHLYADANGNISQTQTFTGLHEYADVYDYSNAEDEAELIQGGTERLKELLQQDDLSVDFDETDDPYDIGDIVGASDNVTGVSIAVPITKKIVRVQNGIITIDFETDTTKVTSSNGSTGGGGGSAGSEISLENVYPVGAIYMSTVETSPNTLFGFGTWEQIKDRFLLSAGDSYEAGATGGEATHTLSKSELPSYSLGKIPGIVPAAHANWNNDNVSATSLGAVSSSKPGVERGSANAITSGTQFGYAVGTGGGGKAHNNMPPYLAVYVWKRTA